jgi:hypothetical protein
LIVVDFVDLNDVGVLEPEEDLALVEKCPDILLTDPFFVDDLDGVLAEVLAENGFFDLGEGTLA